LVVQERNEDDFDRLGSVVGFGGGDDFWARQSTTVSLRRRIRQI
jgi:hypothetical protein